MRRIHKARIAAFAAVLASVAVLASASPALAGLSYGAVTDFIVTADIGCC